MLKGTLEDEEDQKQYTWPEKMKHTKYKFQQRSMKNCNKLIHGLLTKRERDIILYIYLFIYTG